MALGRLHPSDEYDIRIAVEEGEGGSLDGKWIAMLVDEIEHYSGENTRLTALLAERDALAARLAAAEAALEAAHRVICVNTALYHRSAHGGKRFTDFTECPEPSCATASRAALAGSREQAAGEGE